METQDRTEKRAREEVWRQNLKYDIALRAGLAPARADRDLKGQSLRYAEASVAMRQKELQAREVLMRRGLFRTQFMPYFRFVRYLSRAAKVYRGTEFEPEAEAAIARWTGQGCEHGLLVEITFVVFNLRLVTSGEDR